ncbi:hypothetical protein J2X69_005085, partial [Algoriphagus sp. 4150]|uniref:phosphopantetheine-binding protein n=1 Tax=Algoriphagus sp. 4150 TaxID=2817756 RepID=UPI0028641975
KLDKRSLPEADFSSQQSYVGARTETESVLCGIWQEVLGVGRVGVTDDFFRIGGNSILAIQLSHRMGNALGCEIKVADVLLSKNIEMILKHIIASSAEEEGEEWEFFKKKDVN